MIDLAQILLVPFVFTGYHKHAVFALAVILSAYLAWAVHGLIVPHRKTGFLRGIAWMLVLQMFTAIIFGVATMKILYDFDKRAKQSAHITAPASTEKTATR